MILGTGSGSRYAFRFALIGMVLTLCLCVNSWGACRTFPNYSCGYFGSSTKNSCSYEYTCCNNPNETCTSTIGGQDPDSRVVITSCSFNYCYYGFPANGGTCSFIYCDTEAESDSAMCELNPTAEECANACTEDKNECESRGGHWEGTLKGDECTSTCDLCSSELSQYRKNYLYNACCEAGLTPVYGCGFTGPPIAGQMITSDEFLLTCNTANWETTAICDAYFSSSSAAQSSSSSAAQSSSSSAAQSSSSVSEYCLLFPDDLACICADNPQHPDCAYLSSNSSSDSQEPGSSGGGGETSSDSGGGGSPASSGSGGTAGTGDFEYDYRDSLHKIINVGTRTATNTGKIAENTSTIKSILQQARCLFTDCTDYEALKNALDTNIVIPDGDTAGIIDQMQQMGLDTNGLDAYANGEFGINQDSINAALGEMGNKVDGLFSDSVANGILQGYQDIISDNFPTAQWSYTSACPSALTTNVSFNIPPLGQISSGKNLGNYFCNPLPPFNFALGNMIRAVIRLAITIAMAIGIFRTATGFKDE